MIEEYGHNDNCAEKPPSVLPTFAQELAQLINKHSVENMSDTPDWILRDYIMKCLEAFELAVGCRDRWYGVRFEPGMKVIVGGD